MPTITRYDIADMVMAAVPFLVAETDTGKILFVTPALATLFKSNVHGELVGKCVDELLPKRLRDAHRQHREQYAKGPRPMVTGGSMTMGQGRKLMGLRCDGTEFELQIGLTPGLIDGVRVVIVSAISQ